MTNVTKEKRRPLILIVDDDRALLFMAREALQRAGLGVEEAKSGAQALAKLSRFRPDVILMDIDMPGMDGFSTCLKLREIPDGQEIPVVMITGVDDLSSVHKAYEVGATDYVRKPIQWTILAHRLHYMIRATSAAEELRKSESTLTNAQRLARLAWWEWDIATNQLHASTEFYRTLGITADNFEGTWEAFIRCMHSEDRAKVCERVDITLAHGGEFNIDYRVIGPENRERIVHQQAYVERDGVGRPIRLSGIFQDITDRIRAEEEIRQLVYFDSITGLPNRKLFNERLDVVLEQAKRHERRLALLFLDLDRFKRINNTLGIEAGDELIRGVGDRLVSLVRKTDSISRHIEDDHHSTIACLGGDEFMIALTEVDHVHDVAKVAERLVNSLATPFSLRGHEIVTTGSIGIAVFPDDGTAPDELLNNADAAMNHAKQQGGNRYQFYSDRMNSYALERLVLENGLRKAMEREEFEVHYQPQVAVSNGRLLGAEALLRWRHPEKGIVSPLKFIPLAEETGMIVPIGEWVLRDVCMQSLKWQRQGYGPLRVGVNVSGRQFNEEGLAASLAAIIRETGADPSLIELELTESVVMSDAEANSKNLNRLKELGVRLSIDDFGTGYSSLAYLRRFPLDTLKIDRSFLRGVPEDSDQTAITKAIMALAKSLNLRIVAEGVEKLSQLDFLQEQGCDEIQGFLFSRPVPAHEFERFLEAGFVRPDCGELEHSARVPRHAGIDSPTGSMPQAAPP